MMPEFRCRGTSYLLELTNFEWYFTFAFNAFGDKLVLLSQLACVGHPKTREAVGLYDDVGAKPLIGLRCLFHRVALLCVKRPA